MKRFCCNDSLIYALSKKSAHWQLYFNIATPIATVVYSPKVLITWYQKCPTELFYKKILLRHKTPLSGHFLPAFALLLQPLRRWVAFPPRTHPSGLSLRNRNTWWRIGLDVETSIKEVRISLVLNRPPWGRNLTRGETLVTQVAFKHLLRGKSSSYKQKFRWEEINCLQMYWYFQFCTVFIFNI